jgi:hypothetical protein
MLTTRSSVVTGDAVFEVWREAFESLTKEEVCGTPAQPGKIAQDIEMGGDRIWGEASPLCLDDEISLSEVIRATRSLKNGKAVGVDGICNEALKRGGNVMLLSVCALLRFCQRSEQVPQDWKKGLIFPLKKDGDEMDPQNYRGITHMSCVANLYTRILHARLSRYLEERRLIDDHQNGFRPYRGTVDNIFVLSEVLRCRARQRDATYVAFLDVKKAYDKLWRDGLWNTLWELGVRGRMWRILKNLYSGVQSAVKVDLFRTQYFDVETGLRQGCPLSPLLYSVFINGIIRCVETSGEGIKINERSTCTALLYADDIVVLACSPGGLQRCLDAADTYSRQWRFEFNVSKSEVVVFGNGEESSQWTLDGKRLRVVPEYKYLGVEIESRLSWSSMKLRLLSKAARCMAMLCGPHFRFLSAVAADTMWKGLVRPHLEYAAEVWGDGKWLQAERVQQRMARRILGCPSTTAQVALRGEMGWWTLQGRRDLLRLRFYGRLISMDEDRTVKQVYRLARSELPPLRRYRKNRTQSWCVYTRHLMLQLGFQKEWEQEFVGDLKSWNRRVREAIKTRERESWLIEVSARPKLRTYVRLKQNLYREMYVNLRLTQTQRSIIAQLRCGCSRLRVETGRFERVYVAETGQWRSLGPEERICKVCYAEEEDECHFLTRCPAYQDIREKLAVKLEVIDTRLRGVFGWPEIDIVRLLLGARPTGDSSTEMMALVARMVESMMRRREDLLFRVAPAV